MPRLVRVLPVLLLVACAGSEVPPPATDGGTTADGGSGGADAGAQYPANPVLKDVQEQLFDKNCKVCHSASAKQGGLDLSSEANSRAAILNVDPVYPGTAAKGYKRVLPGNSAKSFVYIKVTAPAADEGTFMPQGLAPGDVDPGKIEMLKRWIDQGAK